MNKYPILGIAALTLILCGALWAAQLTPETPAPITASLDMGKALEEQMEPSSASLGKCWTGHTASTAECKEECYLTHSCGFDYWDAASCTCYCGDQL